MISFDNNIVMGGGGGLSLISKNIQFINKDDNIHKQHSSLKLQDRYIWKMKIEEKQKENKKT